jgi:hypothetical protein
MASFGKVPLPVAFAERFTGRCAPGRGPGPPFSFRRDCIVMWSPARMSRSPAASSLAG